MNDNTKEIIPLDVQSKSLERGSHKGKGIAIFTSGGDSQGMNAAVRAFVRFGIYLGCKVYFIKEGYQGMVDGGDNILEADWSSVSGIINKGGTVIGSARCLDFREREGRLKAAKNLIDRGITNLVCIGGDGSLTGSNLFRVQWDGLVKELVDTGRVSIEDGKKCAHLNLVGMVGSIDNDFCGTDITLGCDSALHRIVESVDKIMPTAYSHQRTFILEVMGNNCGYLALVAGIVTEADFVFIPEWPPLADWPDKMCKKLQTERESGRRTNIILVSEGAQDREGSPITVTTVKKVIVDKLNHDTRITVLGHLQRGGEPSAFDRILGSRLGAEAVLALMEAKHDTEASVVSLIDNMVVRVPLMASVEKTQAVAKAMDERNWELASKLRGDCFKSNLNIYKTLTRIKPPNNIKVTGWNLAVMHIGAPCCGMNAAVHAFVRNCLFSGINPIGISNGIDGLLNDEVKSMSWSDVDGWIRQGGAMLGTKRSLPEKNMSAVAAQLTKYNIQGFFIIGGFEAYVAVLQMYESRNKYHELNIPMAILPSTISNNVPGTDFSLGADTAVNEITQICDSIRLSALGTNRRVFVVETMGGNSGYLATMAGLAGGADAAYIPEEKFGIHDLVEDLNAMIQKMNKGHIFRGLILINEKANDNYNVDFVQRLYAEEGKGIFSVRHNVVGHMQQGENPSPFDRNMGAKFGTRAVNWLNNQLSNGSNAAVLMCKAEDEFQSVVSLKNETDFKLRVPLADQWWMNLRSIMKIVAKHDSVYESEGYEEMAICGESIPIQKITRESLITQ